MDKTNVLPLNDFAGATVRFQGFEDLVIACSFDENVCRCRLLDRGILEIEIYKEDASHQD